MTTEKLVKAPERRAKRNPVEGRNRLAVKGKSPDYEYRIVNDTDDRVSDLLDQDWEIDLSEEIRVGDGRIDDIARLGKARVLSVGGNVKAIVMRKRKEWYDEDQKTKQDYVNKTEQAMRADPNSGTYGKIDVTHK